MELLRHCALVLWDTLEDAQVALVPAGVALARCVNDLGAVESQVLCSFVEFEAFMDRVFPACRSSSPDALPPVDHSIFRHNVAHQHTVDVLGADVLDELLDLRD